MTPSDPTDEPGRVAPSTAVTPRVPPTRLPEVPVADGGEAPHADAPVDSGKSKGSAVPVVPAKVPGKGADEAPGAPGEAAKGKESPPIADKVTSTSTTRAAAAWLATAVSLMILVLLIILILENQETVEVRYLGLQGALPLGTALLIAAVAGGAIVTIVGVVRLTQLRIMARRARRSERADTKRH